LCTLYSNVHSLEDGLAEFPGFEEDVLKLLMKYKVGIFQIPCPVMVISDISKQPLSKDAYDRLINQKEICRNSRRSS